MSKKTKDSVNEYFSHDYHARNDPKLQKLQAKMGHEGKGIYWDIIELLYEQAGKLLVSEIETYAFSIRCEKIAFQNVISDFDLFTDDGEYFWSASVLKRLKLRGIKSANASKSANKRWKKLDANALRTHSEGIANALPTHSDRNAIKEKKRKEKNIKEYEIKENESELTRTPDFENLNFKSSDSEPQPTSQPEQKKQTGPGRKKQAGKPTSLEDSQWGDRAAFDAALPDWDQAKLDHYWEALKNYSNKGNKYIDWILTAQSWERSDRAKAAKNGSQQGHASPREESPGQADTISELIRAFNQYAGMQIDEGDTGNRGCVADRLMAGADPKDMHEIIQLKCLEWGTGENRKYLRIAALFSDKNYQNFLQEVRDIKAGKKQPNLTNQQIGKLRHERYVAALGQDPWA